MNSNVRYNIIKSISFFLLFLLSQAMGPHIKILGVTPNFIFLLVLIASLVENTTYANLFYALVFGSFFDVYNGKIFGIYTVLFVVISFLASEIYHKYFEDMTAVQVLFIVLATFLYSFVICIFFAFRDNSFIQLFTQISLPEFVYNALLGIVLFFIYKTVVKRLMSPRRSRYF
ncbi:rod shape-determining protein MreD [Acetivibrio sp. MSJd-27]|jgi:rod shape-determining protein mreD|uniref:rod shape-determining protein MreD n=1 Tax=Acetivibrio sp. MSJd-27 TaxID=2841523 RepID=UPI001C0F630A|nr:rod shape-determining protein MreD [Acetivibrio sp. MSJd-27]MBU5450419.1 rod shape-determining protein MreD [Acetivibrio sp. MSJd-27]